MSNVKIEAFFSTSNNANDECLAKLLEEIKCEFGDSVEIATYRVPNELFETYSLTATPAIVVEEMIKLVGFCPSKETLVAALRESGLE